MKKWQKFISEHLVTKILSDTQVMIFEIEYDLNTGESYDHVVTKLSNKFRVDVYLHGTEVKVNTYNEKTIRDYLGY